MAHKVGIYLSVEDQIEAQVLALELAEQNYYDSRYPSYAGKMEEEELPDVEDVDDHLIVLSHLS